MKWIRKILSPIQPKNVVQADVARKEKVEKAAKDFAVRFEDVMRDLAQS